MARDRADGWDGEAGERNCASLLLLVWGFGGGVGWGCGWVWGVGLVAVAEIQAT